jgi:hypothetical protein
MTHGGAHVVIAIRSMLLSRAPKPTALRCSPAWRAVIRRRVGTVSAAIVLGLSAASAWPAYFTSTLGSALAGPSDCDDCFEQVSFGAGQSINYFGQIYDSLFVGSNGYVTFGSGLTEYTPHSLLPRFAPPMIAAVWTDLDTRDDVDSNVLVDTSTSGQIVVTWDGSGHYDHNYAVRTFAQLVVRSSQFVVPAGQGQIGFFYGAITDPNHAVAGLSNGNPTVDDGDQEFHSGAASDLSDRELWLPSPSVNVPPVIEPFPVPEPEISAALAIGLLAAGLARTRRYLR